MKKFVIAHKWIFTCLAIVLVPILINYLLLTWTFPGVQGKYDDWLGFFSNYSGGIIGGMVALIVANFQVKKQMEEQIKNEEEVKYINQLPTLLNITFELDKMKSSVENAIVMRNALISFNEQVAVNMNHQFHIDHAQYDMKLLNNENWQGLQVIQDVEFQKSLILLRNNYTEIAEALKYDIDEIESQIAELMNAGGINLKQLKELTLKKPIIEGNKEWAWKELLEKDYPKVIEDTLKTANIVIKAIEEMMEKRHAIRDKE